MRNKKAKAKYEKSFCFIEQWWENNNKFMYKYPSLNLLWKCFLFLTD